MSNAGKKSDRFIIFFSFGAFVLGGVGVFFWQQYIKDAELQESYSQIETMQEQLDKYVLEGQSSTRSEPANNKQANATPQLPAVAYEPGGVFPDSLRRELSQKLIEPYSDFYSSAGSDLVSFHISEIPGASGWRVVVVSSDGTHRSLNFGNQEKSTQAWWAPICLTPCHFSDEFKEQYPEIVSEYYQQ